MHVDFHFSDVAVEYKMRQKYLERKMTEVMILLHLKKVILAECTMSEKFSAVKEAFN